ncbi:MAG: methionine adenosyltransferase [Bacilli bacterium]
MGEKKVKKDTTSGVEKLFSNEIVFEGHPDKVCDQISASILQAYIAKDKKTHAGIECCGGKGKIFITGEVTSKARVNVNKIVKNVLRSVGYKTNYKVINNIGIQSPDINQGVSKSNGDIGAGDQGMMFGYACNDTKELLPTAMVILQEFAKFYSSLRKENSKEFYPDGKAQITGVYDENFKLKRIKTFVISYQNSEQNRNKTDEILRSVASSIANNYNISIEEFLINPTGKFLIGGFDGDAGLTGRKIVVDAYQSFANVGGGCMNGKDPSKVDFSAAHKARELAKRILQSKKLNWAEVQLSYAIGVAEPVAIYIDSNKGSIEPPKSWYKECKPANIINDLNLLDADYVELAKYGHFTK